MSNYNSGQFKCGVGRWMQPGQLAQVGQKLAWIGNGSSNNLFVYEHDLSALLTDDTSKVKNNWTDTKMSDKGVHKNGYNLQTNHATGGVSLGTEGYYFWVDTHNSTLCAIRYAATPNTSNGYDYHWDRDFAVLQISTGAAKGVASDVSAVLIGNYILVTYSADGKTLSTLKLDPSAYNLTTKQWVATQVSNMDLTSRGISSLNHLSTEWFCVGPDYNYLMVMNYVSSSNTAYPFIFRLDTNLMPDFNSFKAITSFSAAKGVAIRRDPSSRIVAVYAQNASDNNLRTRVYKTIDMPGQPVNAAPLLHGSFEAETKLNNVDHSDSTMPAILYVSANAQAGSVNVPSTNGKSYPFNATTANVYQYVIYGNGNKSGSAYDILAQVVYYGQVAFVPSVAKSVPPVTHPMILQSVIDPFPIPQTMMNQYPNSTAMTYYGTKSGLSSKRSTSVSVQVGIKGNYTTTAGVGPALDVQMSAGPQSSAATSVETTISTNFGSYAGGYKGYQDGSVVVPFGELWGSSLPPIYEDALYFFDAGANLVNGADAPFFSHLRVDPNSSDTTHPSNYYKLFSSNPGDLDSYTTAAINATMAAKYNALSPNDKSYFTPSYNGNYFNGVIVPNAYAFGPTDPNDPEKGRYLSYNVGIGKMGQVFEQLTTVMNEWGWSYNSSVYAGVSGGANISAGVGILSMTVSNQFSFLAGFDFSGSVSEAQEQSEMLSVMVDMTNLAPTNPSYEVRLYLLPANPLWAREIAYFSENGQQMGEKIDFMNSAPFKIFFRVIPNQ